MAARQQFTNIALVSAVGLVGAYLYFTQHAVTSSENDSERGPRGHHVVKIYRPEALTELQIEREGQSFRLFRQAEAADAGAEGRPWKIEQDGKTDVADAFAVDKATGNLDHAYHERTIKPEEVNRAQFGLEKPRFKVTLVMGPLRSTFAIGGPAATPPGAVYVDDNGAVKVIKQSSLDFLDLPPESFRSRAVVPYLSPDLRQMRFAHGDVDFTLEKLAGLTWKLATSDQAGTRAERFNLERMLGTFADLKADHFLTEAAARQAQAGAPQVKVTLVHGDAGKAPGEFTVGGPCPDHPDEVVVIRSSPKPLYACSAKGSAEALRRTVEQMADSRPFSLRDDEMEEVTLEQGDKKLEIARKGNNWRQRLPVEADVAADQAKALVKALGTTRGELPRRAAPEGFEAVARVTVRGPRENEDARPAEVIEVGKPAKDGSTFIKRQQDGAFIRLDRDQARSFFPRTTALRSTRLIEHSIDQARKIRIHEGSALLQSLEKSTEGTWKLVAPKGYPVDIGVVSEIAENLLHLSADQWVADRDDGSFGLEKPRFKAELDLDAGDAGARGYHLLLGEVSPSGGTYGRIEEIEGVFTVPRALEQTLSALAIDLAVFMVALEDGDRITFKRPEGSLTLVMKGGQYRAAEGPELPPSKLDNFKLALNELRAQSVVHLGDFRKEEGSKPTLEISVKRAPGHNAREVKLIIGASDVLKGASVFYARAEGVDATYAIPAARVKALLALL